jgi:hypothetical protein
MKAVQCDLAERSASRKGSLTLAEEDRSEACKNGRLCGEKPIGDIYVGWRIAKSCCFVESVGDTFAQC